jgi:hypothetical protein
VRVCVHLLYSEARRLDGLVLCPLRATALRVHLAIDQPVDLVITGVLGQAVVGKRAGGLRGITCMM